MKKLLLLLIVILFSSCEQVVDLNLSTAPSKLVIDASINWQKGTLGNVQTIKLSTTTEYYSGNIPTITGATVYITNSFNSVFNFVEKINPTNNVSIYTCNNFLPVVNETYVLTIIYNGQTYKAFEKLLAVPSIINVEQRNDLGLKNNEIGIKANFKDWDKQTNFYLSSFETKNTLYPDYQIISDEFSDGNILSALYSNKNLATGSLIDITIYGVSKTYYNYMNLLLKNSGLGNPFQTTPTIVRGNIINQTNTDNYPLGYFRLSEIDKLTYIVK